MLARLLSLQNFCISGALFCIVASLALQPSKKSEPIAAGNLRKFSLPAALSFGHRELAWSIWGLAGLSASVNAWDAETNSQIEPEKRALLRNRLRDFADNLPEFAREQIGMREVFIFPASYFAFLANDTDLALEIARMGAQDPRISADLTLTEAYITHLFKNDLNAAADAYQRLLDLFPQAQWLNKTINALRAGRDPFFERPEELQKNCKQLLLVFPLAKAKLIDRGICSPENSL